ncbi:MAG: hypothetical protein QG635_1587 [Bacteroidota bacterium]|nr:hypothetical protein [Bacteroidota bacterium]
MNTLVNESVETDELIRIENIRHEMSVRFFYEIIFLIFLLPFFIISLITISLIIKLNSGGNIFYIQRRIGMDLKPFNLIKFRTMNGTEEFDKICTELDNARITKCGCFLRKHRLDEIPQIINIFKGEMSLIGPRPDHINLFKKFNEDFPQYCQRYIIRPGITGYAQVYYKHTDDLNGAIEKYKYDMEYLRKYSFQTDIKILLKTLSVMISGNGST